MKHQDLKSQSVTHFGLAKAERLLLAIFLFSLPLLNPWVRGDGVGYYAFARALLIEHRLNFEKDYQSANASFRDPRLDQNGQPKDTFRTPTGHLDNHFTVGPAILWSPFLLLAHLGVFLARAMGSSVAADGFSAPYRIAMALATAVYGFFGLLLSFRIARHYVAERWALLATIAIWCGTSLPVYIYFNPSWSHAHSAFAVALLLWYWHATRAARTLRQWLLLGVLAGLMLNVYYPNAMVLVVLVVEGARQYGAAFSTRSDAPDRLPLPDVLGRHLLLAIVLVVCLLPTFITRHIIYGSGLESGYIPLKNWLWRSPVFLAVLFSSNHGLLFWTPILLLAIVGLCIFWRRTPRVGGPFLAAFLAFYVFIACYPDWAGISSYGNRFFVSLTPLFIVGLSVFLDWLEQFFHSRRAALATACAVIAGFILWNAGLIFQWGTHLLPARGPVSFSQMIHNQLFTVPREFSSRLHAYLFQRKTLMEEIERRDIKQMNDAPHP
ncbi:MAG TPA: glycosyltransferase family 39 protein [Candidatus Dormibacteraeota bacterium]|nr:glycosyltransferase family 39 protein [Candidatus Dormibacteraeota bacterium]